MRGWRGLLSSLAVAAGVGLACMVQAQAAHLNIAFVINSRSASVDEINVDTHQLIREVPVFREPHHMALTPDGRSLVVGDTAGNALFFLDPRTGVLQRYITMSDPYQIVFSPDGQYLTVAGLARNQVDIYDAKTFKLKLKRPLALVPFALGSAVGQIPVIMRESDAKSDPMKPITETIGSGPFKFNREEWRSGSKVVYDRNPDYVPRSEPADGLAGGRVVKVDRVEWLIMPDAATAAAALQTGEIDIWEQPSQDLIPTITTNRDIKVERYSNLANQVMLRPNHLYPPFDNPKARLALAYATDQADFLAAGFGDEEWWKRCNAYFVCGSPNGTEIGTESYAKPDLEKARQLLKESGYKGEKLVLSTSNDIAPIGRMAEVAADSLKKVGFNVDVQFADWGAVTTRQQNKSPPDQGGWNLFVTYASGATMQSPLTNIGTNMACERAWAGWPCDAEAEKLRGAFVDAPDDASRKIALEALHKRLAEVQPYRVLGQFDQPYARRSNVSGVLAAPVMLFWNVEKK